ncbi:peroxidase family protein [Mesorhizobium marinum]|uniref:Heme peroxidase family protein n=1 Tax=Mesorhizobium marinum TaxID=3228790 RepID=A0ABV3QV94_9HYPH
MATSKHGSAVRGMDNVPHSSIRDQRFGRMFRYLPAADYPESALVELGETVAHGEFAERIAAGVEVDTALNETDENENTAIPSGYTYLGQFIDHDITFDPMSSLDRFNDPDALQDFRTPRLDLDSVYGSGPDDQPFLYDSDGKHLLLGDDKDFDKSRNSGPDLPRNTANPRRALIGDKRNDENLIVSQLHATFLRFHNKVFGTEAGGDFDLAQQIVRWHYQWIVLHDFIPRIVGPQTYQEVIGGPGGMPVHRFYDAKGRYAFIPVEFSVAAYRFGHSQVRPSYALNRIVRGPNPTEQPFGGAKARFHRIPIFSLMDVAKNPLANLNGFRELPDFWAMDWAFFFDGVAPHGGAPDGAILPQPSYRIDTTLVDPLTSLPDRQNEMNRARRSLATLNLLRGWRMGLPSGQSVARKMGLDPLGDDVLFDHPDPARAAARKALLDHSKNRMAGSCPLWFYLLREAEVLAGGAHLGPVGGVIVAEVLSGLILEDRFSFLAQWPNWRPTLPGATPGQFTMADLINFTNA